MIINSTLLIVSIIFQIYFCVKIFKFKILNPILSILIPVYSIIWIIIPGLISTLIYLSIIEFSSNYVVITDDYVILYILESFVFLISINLGLIYIKRKKYFLEAGLQFKKIHLYLIISGMIIIIINLYSQSESSTYLDRNDATLYGTMGGFSFSRAFQVVVYSFAIYALVNNVNDKLLLLLIFLAVTVASIIFVKMGSRIAMLLPLLIYFMRLKTQGKNINNLLKNIIIMTPLLFILMNVSSLVSEIREQGFVSLSKKSIVTAKSINFTSISTDLFTKFNSYSSGLDLIKEKGSGAAGFKPYIGSGLIFMPRFLFPKRPVAGSIDGTIWGTPARLAANARFISETYNVGVSPLAVTVWHFGWLMAPFILILFGAVNLIILQRVLKKKKLLYSVLGIGIINIPTLSGIFNSPDAILKNIVLIGMCIFFIKIFYIFKSIFYN